MSSSCFSPSGAMGLERWGGRLRECRRGCWTWGVGCAAVSGQGAGQQNPLPQRFHSLLYTANKGPGTPKWSNTAISLPLLPHHLLSFLCLLLRVFYQLSSYNPLYHLSYCCPISNRLVPQSSREGNRCAEDAALALMLPSLSQNHL